jgi:hypothetical protein
LFSCRITIILRGSQVTNILTTNINNTSTVRIDSDITIGASGTSKTLKIYNSLASPLILPTTYTAGTSGQLGFTTNFTNSAIKTIAYSSGVGTDLITTGATIPVGVFLFTWIVISDTYSAGALGNITFALNSSLNITLLNYPGDYIMQSQGIAGTAQTNSSTPSSYFTYSTVVYSLVTNTEINIRARTNTTGQTVNIPIGGARLSYVRIG